MSQTTVIICVVLFLFLFFVLCTKKSENYNYDIGNDNSSHCNNLGLTELLQNKAKLCIDEKQREAWNQSYKDCQLYYMYGRNPPTDYCCLPPPPSCDSLREDIRDDYIKLDSYDVQSKLNDCGKKYKIYVKRHGF